MFALVTLVIFHGTLRAVTTGFPTQGDDNTQSLGQFNVLVNPAFQPMMAGYPGYSATTHVLTSPTLFDPATIIGRSTPLLDGSASDAAGVPVGSAGTIVGDSSFSVQPGGLGPVNTREVHTQLRSLNMTGGGAAVRAGTTAPTRPISAGEVESLSGASGNPALDFPAKSFFDVFVEVDLPPGGSFPGATSMTNSMPLLIQNTNVTSFPPQVVYVHGMSTAVPIKFSTSNPPNWNAGDTFGLLQLAGTRRLQHQQAGTHGHCGDSATPEHIGRDAASPRGTAICHLGARADGGQQQHDFPEPGRRHHDLAGHVRARRESGFPAVYGRLSPAGMRPPNG